MSDLNKKLFILIKAALKLPSADCQLNLSALLSLNSINNPETAVLQKILQRYNDDDALEKLVEAPDFPFGSLFRRFIVNYLILIRDFNPWSILQSIDLMLNYYRHLSRCFENKDLTSILQKTMVDSTEFLIPLAQKVDAKFGLVNNEYKKFTRLEYLTELVLSIFNKIIISKTQIDENLISYLAIKIMKLYFLIQKPRLCNNILTNIRNLGLQFDNISKANKINYNFLVGKFYFLQESFIKSFVKFEECLSLVKITTVPTKNLLIILKYLIPNGLLVGRIPNFASLAKLIQISEQSNKKSDSKHYEVINFYQPLLHFIKQGDLNSVNSYILQHESSLKSANLLIPLIQRTRIVTIRHLVRRIYLINGNKLKNTLDFESIKVGLQVSIGAENFPKSYKIIPDNSSIDDITVETIFINLIDQQLIKANIFSRLKLIRFSKTNNFPTIYEVYKTKYL